MGGIINYYHGEGGVVADCWWQLLDDLLSYQIEVTDDPHRVWARDYNTDIGIDPAIRPGDHVVYLRLDDTSGIWVRESDQVGSKLDSAIIRVGENREWMSRWAENSGDIDEVSNISQEIFEATGNPLRIVMGEPQYDGPATPVSFFLSYSSRNTLFARQIYQDLINDAKTKIWFDLAQQKHESLTHDEAIAKWLEESIYDCQGFTLLLTRSAVESGWVSREIAYAMDKKDLHRDFHILILKTDNVDIPESVQNVGKIIECDRIWWSRGIAEELFASIYGRCGRKSWLVDQIDGPWSEGTTLGYEDLVSESGTVLKFDWSVTSNPGSDFCRKYLSWCLEIMSPNGESAQVTGDGDKKPVDLDMKPGDRVAFINLRRRWGCDIEGSLPLWMRSDDLAVTPDLVLDRYYEALEINSEFIPTRKRMDIVGEDAWGRIVADILLQDQDEQWHRYTDLLWVLQRKHVSAANIAQRLLAGSHFDEVNPGSDI